MMAIGYYGIARSSVLNVVERLRYITLRNVLIAGQTSQRRMIVQSKQSRRAKNAE